jgi:hypothetical protein
MAVCYAFDPSARFVRFMKYYRVLPLVLVTIFSGFAGDKPLTIGWANVQWPPATNHVVSATNRTPVIYGQVWIEGVSNQPGAAPKLLAQLGLGPAGSNPHGNANWSWVDATYNLDVGNNDEFMASLLPDRAGSFDYVYRYSTTGGTNWVYADLKGLIENSQAPANPGKLTVSPSADNTPPQTPSGLVVAGASPSEIKLAWRKLMGDPTLHGYEVLRSANGGTTYNVAGLVTTNTFTDSTVKRGTTYFYKVRAVDLSFNRSETSSDINVSPDRSISVTFNVTVPQTTESSGKPVFLAGTLSQLNGGMPDWDPGSLTINRIDANHWTMTLCGKEGAMVAYKYTLGSWDNVEKGEKCDEVSDRQFKLTPGATDAMIVEDTVVNWRNIAPCKD